MLSKRIIVQDIELEIVIGNMTRLHYGNDKTALSVEFGLPGDTAYELIGFDNPIRAISQITKAILEMLNDGSSYYYITNSSRKDHIYEHKLANCIDWYWQGSYTFFTYKETSC